MLVAGGGGGGCCCRGRVGCREALGRVGGGAGQVAAFAPDLAHRQFRFLGSDGQGWVQLLGGLVVGLIALYSSHDHINFAAARVQLEHQWGIWFTAASLAVVAVVAAGFCEAVAQLATRTWLRAADEKAKERDRADQERDRSAEARERQAEDAERQRQGIALLRGAALLRARVQLDPSEPNRSRLNAFLVLLAQEGRSDCK
jgi:hypothetical protein